MAQRLGIAAAMLGDPPVLLFDEPANGLDPEGIRWLRTFLRSLAADGRTVLVSSHLMSELEGIADDLVVIGRGRLISQTSVSELLSSRSDGRVHVRTPQVAEVMAALAGAGGTVTSTGSDALVVAGLEPDRIAELVAEHGLRLHELYRERASLEDAFIDMTRDAVEYVAERPGAGS
jgi:ABC-2 type transport system ATP-binding protein